MWLSIIDLPELIRSTDQSNGAIQTILSLPRYRPHVDEIDTHIPWVLDAFWKYVVAYDASPHICSTDDWWAWLRGIACRLVAVSELVLIPSRSVQGGESAVRYFDIFSHVCADYCLVQLYICDKLVSTLLCRSFKGVEVEGNPACCGRALQCCRFMNCHIWEHKVYMLAHAIISRTMGLIW